MDLAGILPLASQGPPRQLAGAGTPSLPGGCLSSSFAAASHPVKSEAALPAVGVKGEAEAGSLESSQSQSQPETQLREPGGCPSGQTPALTAAKSEPAKSEPALMEAPRGPQTARPKLENA